MNQIDNEIKNGEIMDNNLSNNYRDDLRIASLRQLGRFN